MSAKHIITQDRDFILPLDPHATLYTVPNIYEGTFMGINLMLSTLLGTFDSPAEAVREITAIHSFNGTIYPLSGFSDWPGGV